MGLYISYLERERKTERERDRKRDRERERDRKRDRERERDRKRDRERETERGREREREGERGRELTPFTNVPLPLPSVAGAPRLLTEAQTASGARRGQMLRGLRSGSRRANPQTENLDFGGFDSGKS